MEKYTFIREIGSGSFGKVFLVKSKQQGINYVVKQVDLNKLDKRQSKSASKEVELLAKLRHNNIVSYKESYEKNNRLNIVLEYCENGDLYDKIKEKRMSNKLFGDNEVLDYFVQICLALEYIHGQKILHRDLKTKNIFLTKGNVIKLGDFGIAKVLENSFELAQTCLGSPFYLSPEICESKPYNKKSDVWALGCVLYELTTLRYAFVAKNVKNMVAKILAGAYNPLPSNTNAQIRSLISSMLRPNPQERPSVRELLEKRFLTRRRATFVCKAHKNELSKKRSSSGDFPSMVFGNQVGNGLRQKRRSASCFQLNRHVSTPETKYKPPNNKSDKKLTIQNQLNNSREERKEKHPPSGELLHGCKVNNLEKLNVKLPKVDSEYYDLIAGFDRKGKLGKKENSVGKQAAGDDSHSVTKINQRPDSGGKMRKIEQGHAGVALTRGADAPKENYPDAGEFNVIDMGNDQRKRWVKNTLQRKTLLAILSDAELLEGSFQSTSERLGPDASIDDLLSLRPSEMSDDVLLPINVQEMENKNLKNHQYQLLQQEVNHLREKFELNNRKYQIEDLIRLVDNSKKILNLEPTQKFTEHERKMEESVFYNLEYRKMTLERRVGFRQFFNVYGKMIDIINEDLEPTLKTSLESPLDGLKTYVISSKANVSGDSDDVIKNTWKSIINVLDDKQEYLPDLWELAVSENIYYHL